MNAADKAHSFRDRYEANRRIFFIRSANSGNSGIIADGFVSSVDIAPRGNVN